MLGPSTPRLSASTGSDPVRTFTSTASVSLRTRSTPTAGELTPQALSRIETRLLPEIESAEKRALPQFISPLVAEVAGADAREWWAHLSIVQKREIISTPTEIRLMKSKPGRWEFDPSSVEITWRR